MNYILVNNAGQIKNCRSFKDAINKFFEYDGGEVFLTDGVKFYDKLCNDWAVNAEFFLEDSLNPKEKKILLNFCSQFSPWEMPHCLDVFLNRIKH